MLPSDTNNFVVFVCWSQQLINMSTVAENTQIRLVSVIIHFRALPYASKRAKILKTHFKSQLHVRKINWNKKWRLPLSGIKDQTTETGPPLSLRRFPQKRHCYQFYTWSHSLFRVEKQINVSREIFKRWKYCETKCLKSLPSSDSWIKEDE